MAKVLILFALLTSFLDCSDCFAQWTQISGGLIHCLADSGSKLYASGEFAVGSEDFLVSTDHGLTWDTLCDSMGTVAQIVVQGNILFTVGWDLGIFRSTDGGISWERLNMEGIDSEGIGELIAANSSLYVLSGWSDSVKNRGIYRSTDSGQTWVKMGNGPSGLSMTDIEYGFGNLYTATDSNFFNYAPSGLFKSPDNGITWTTVSEPQSNAEEDYFNGSTCIAVLGSFDSDYSTADSMLVSVDSGHTWNLSFLWGGINAACSSEGVLFSGRYQSEDGGNPVFMSVDTGKEWIPVGGPKELWSLAISPPNIIAASDFGIWVAPIAELESMSIVQSDPNLKNNISVYPNPTTGLVTISGAAGTVTVENLLGQISTTPYSLIEKAGDVSLDLTNEPAGIYFVRVDAANGAVTQKIVKY